jgi:hypothetical protein
MDTSWKTILLAALGTMGMAFEGYAQDRTLTVLVLDYAGLSDSSLNEMESLSGLLLSRAGIRTSGSIASGIKQVRCRHCAAQIWKRDRY